MPVRIYHNPRCSTSRKTLALLRDKGVEPEIVEYLNTPYTAAQLKTLLGQLKMPARALIRKKEAAEAGIDPAKLSDEQLIAAMAKHPIIVERPIVVSGNKAGRDEVGDSRALARYAHLTLPSLARWAPPSPPFRAERVFGYSAAWASGASAEARNFSMTSQFV